MPKRPRNPEDSLSAEMRDHLERLTREYIDQGMNPHDAEQRARQEFGGLEQLKEECRDVRGHRLEDLGKDLRYAARAMRRSPGFVAVAVLSLALGIGGNTAIFSIINSLMLRQLPVQDPGRLALVTRVSEQTPDKPDSVSYPLYEYFRDRLKSISTAEAEQASSPVITIDGAEESVDAEWVSGSYYGVLGVRPAAGRLLTSEDDAISPALPAAVISYRYWQQRFGLSPAAIGKTFSIRDKVFTIVGVTPLEFQGTRPERNPDITISLLYMLSPENRTEKTNNMLTLVARLKPGVSIAQANAEVQVVFREFRDAIAATLPARGRPRFLRQQARVFPAPAGVSPMRFDFSRPLTVLMGIVALTLLLACANLSGLLLARAAARQREVSIRLAIGAGRGRLLRQFAAESLLLAVLGGVAGLILAAWMNRALVNLFVNGGKLRFSAPTDWRVLTFTAVISLLACVLAGVAPGLHAMRANLNPALKETRARGGFGIGKSLVVAQLAISMVLVVGATLFIGTLIKLNSVDRGMNTDGVLLFSIRARQAFPPERSLATQNALLDRVANLPGVTSVTAASVIPIAGSLWSRDVQVEGYTLRPDEVAEVGFNAIAPRYFATVQTPIVLGREFDRHDTDVSPKVTVVNESFARYFFGESSPLGKHVTSVAVTYEIVGVVKDAKYQALRSGMIKSMYIPAPQRTGETVVDYTYMARIAGGDPGALSPVLQRLVPEIDPLLRLRVAQRYDVLVDQGIVTERIMAALGGFFGLLALVIACIGIFGMLAFQVSRRTNEMGVRMALGAGRGDIRALVLREVAILLAAGTAFGTVAAVTLTGLAGKLLFGVTPTSPSVFATAAAALCGASLIAGWIPARRAAGIDPMAALRHD